MFTNKVRVVYVMSRKNILPTTFRSVRYRQFVFFYVQYLYPKLPFRIHKIIFKGKEGGNQKKFPKIAWFRTGSTHQFRGWLFPYYLAYSTPLQPTKYMSFLFIQPILFKRILLRKFFFNGKLIITLIYNVISLILDTFS